MLSDIRYATRIRAGFLLLAGVALSIAGLGYATVAEIADTSRHATSQLSEFGRSSLLAAASLRLARDVEWLQRDPSPETRMQVDAGVREVRARLGRATETEVGSGIVRLVERYLGAVAELVGAVEAWRDLKNSIREVGIATRRDIGRLAEMLNERGEPALAFLGLRASEQFLLARVRMERFIEEGNLAEYESATAPLEATIAALGALGDGPLEDRERALLAVARDGVESFGLIMASSRQVMVDWLAQARRGTEAFKTVHAALEALDSGLEERAGAILEDVASSLRRADTTFLTGTVLLLALTTASIPLVMSFGRAIRRTVEQTKRLAAGEFDTVIDGKEGKNELAELARALEVFRTAQLEARRLASETEQLKASELERQQREVAEQASVVRALGDGLRRLAEGDLTTRIDSTAADPFPAEYEALRAAFNETVERLAGLLSRMRDAADVVTVSVAEIADAASNLSGRAETQAATLEQSAAALAQLTESVRSTAERAQTAAAASNRNLGEARLGEEIVREAIEAMQVITSSAEKIQKIIGAIDDIAFQTNLLALNAGVEAARAGEAGRGFAVVASEVRNLAQRASQSAHEIKALIGESGEQVRKGSALVARTGERLTSILTEANEVSRLVAEIAAAAAEQAAAITEVNGGVSQLDRVTQENAAVAEQLSALAANLNSKASDLAREVAAFRTSSGASVERIGPATPSVFRSGETRNPRADVRSTVRAERSSPVLATT